MLCLLSLSRAFVQVLVGVRFLRQWPFIGRVRVCFVEPPYFQMTVKPLFGHGLDVTELPGISGWLVSLSSLVYCFHFAKKYFIFQLHFNVITFLLGTQFPCFSKFSGQDAGCCLRTDTCGGYISYTMNS